MKGKFLDFWRRVETGPMMFEKEYMTRHYYPLLKQTCEKYGFKYEEGTNGLPSEVVPCNNETIDNIWEAAKEFVVKCGVLCQNTERVIYFTEDEVNDAMYHVPKKVTVGSHTDEYTWKHRGLEDYGVRNSGKNPNVAMGRILGPITDDVYEKVGMSFVKEPMVDMMHFQGVIAHLDGVDIKPFSPFEMMSEMKRVSKVKDVCRRGGRPYLHDGASMPISLQAEMMGTYGPGINPGDAHHVYLQPHLKTNYDEMCRALMWHQFGSQTWGIGMAYIGSIPGAAATSAVNCLAELIAYETLYQPTMLGVWPTDALYFSNSSKYSLFVANWAVAAMHKHTKIPSILGAAWQMTSRIGYEYFWETAAGAIGSVSLGAGTSGGTGEQSGGTNCAAGIGARFAAEVGRAVGEADLKREEANEMVIKCLGKYQKFINDRTAHKMGWLFQECYDLDTIEPLDKLNKVYKKVKGEMRKELGLRID